MTLSSQKVQNNMQRQKKSNRKEHDIAFSSKRTAAKKSVAFSSVLDAAERLDVESQAELVAVLTRRLRERARERIASTVAESRREFAAGQYKEMTAREIVREALG